MKYLLRWMVLLTWLADKVVILGDYGKDAAFELIRLAQFEREHTKPDGGMMAGWDM